MSEIKDIRVKITKELIRPAYISFESALFDLGLRSYGPVNYQCATLFEGLRKELEGTEYHVHYIGLPEDYFFGYYELDGFFIAEPEKAVLDYIYKCEMRGWSPKLFEIDFSEINKKKLRDYAKRMDIDIESYLNQVYERAKKARTDPNREFILAGLEAVM